MPALLVLALLVALSGARPQSHREVKLITEPRPGQEYVMIQSSVFQPRHAELPEQDFMTSHKIPGKLPVDDPEDLILKTTKSKIKRESDPDSFSSEEEELEPKVAEVGAETPEQPKKIEVRTEFSVVTSKPRKGSKEAKERAIAFAAKETSSGHAPQVAQPEVNVETKGDTGKLEATVSGADEKKVMIKKLSAADHVTKVAVKEEQTIKEVEVKPSSELGVNSPQVEEEEGIITVPLQKKQAVSTPPEVSTPLPNHTSQSPSEHFEILPVNILPKTAEKNNKDNNNNNKEKDFDFVDSSSLTDKVLVPAGSNQQSRIEVKKGPNGQDYEYEYVYYYYDDDENDAAGGTGAKKTAVVKGSTTTTAEPTTTSRHYLPKKESSETPAAAPHHHDKDAAAGHGTTRGRTRGQSAAVAAEEKHEAKTRYTSIERATTATPADTANEIIPARGAASARTRGRTLTTEEPTVAEERLPVNTRFPPRSRSNHNSNSVASTTPLPQDAPAPRARGSSGANSVRRPSLELVDSSSFKTQSSDVSRDQDPRPEFPKTLPAANEEEEVVKPRGRGRGQASTTPAPAAPVADEDDEDIPSESHSRGQLSRRPDTAIRSRGQVNADDEEEEDEVVSVPESVTEVPEDTLSLTTITDVDVGLTAAAMDKAALELYAVLSQARAESNSVDDESTDLASDDELTTELEDVSTTLEPTTEAPTTTTTTTTTPAPTTTTTTTETPLAAGRGRYRQRGGSSTGASGTRNRFRADKGEAASTSTTEAAVETSTKGRARFGSNRVTSGTRRGGFSKSTTPRSDEEAASGEHEATKQEAKTDAATPTHRAGGLPARNRFGAARTPKVTTAATTAAASSDDAPAHSSSAPIKPVFADRFNLRKRGGGIKLHSTPAPAVAAEETKAETSGDETNDSPAEPSTTAASVRLPGRNRLSVGSGPRPLRPGPRVNIAPRGRLGAAVTTTTVAPSTEAEDASSEQTSSSSQEEAQPDEAQEVVTTPAPDALTRLRNRPRLRVSAVKPTSAPTAAPIRRPLIPRRKLGHPAEVKESTETETQDSTSDDTPASSEETSESSGEEVQSPVTPEAEQPQGLASLVSGRRRGNALRRPRTLLPGGSRAANQAS